jgi:hypothetical protein
MRYMKGEICFFYFYNPLSPLLLSVHCLCLPILLSATLILVVGSLMVCASSAITMSGPGRIKYLKGTQRESVREREVYR